MTPPHTQPGVSSPPTNAGAWPEAIWAEALFAASDDMVSIVDLEGRTVYQNRAVAAGASYFDALPADSRQAARSAHARCAQTGQTARWEGNGPSDDGGATWRVATVSALRRGDEIVATLSVAVDVSAQHREQERLRRYEAMMVDTQGVAHYGVWEWEITQPVAVWSPGLYAIYGLDAGTYVPSYEEYLKHVHPDDRQRVIDATNRVFHEHQPYSHDERILHADGGIRYLHTWAVPVLDEQGRLLRLIGVCQDITDRKLAENALAERVDELARSNADLERFAHVASHDLQEPLRMVASHVQMLERRYAGRLGPDADEAIGFAVDGAKRMKALIDDLLDYSRVGAARSKRIAVDPTRALESAKSSLAPEIQATRARIIQSPLPCVRAQPAPLVSVFQNLLSNSLKFRGASDPEIRVSAAVRDGVAEFVVSDNGLGIEPEYHGRIFDVFQRLDRDTPGTGVGLAICRKIIEQHGGRIWVESRLGQGSAFHFTLPTASLDD